MLPALTASLILGCLLASPAPTGGAEATDNGRAALGLDEALRRRLDVAIKAVEGRQPTLSAPATGLAQARRLAKVDEYLSWEAEYRGWYVFAKPGPDGRPDLRVTFVLVKKGAQVVGTYQETARLTPWPYGRPFGVPNVDPAPPTPWRRR
jgi:hypothetical protein